MSTYPAPSAEVEWEPVEGPAPPVEPAPYRQPAEEPGPETAEPEEPLLIPDKLDPAVLATLRRWKFKSVNSIPEMSAAG